MRKLFSIIAAVLFAGSMMAAEVLYTLDTTDENNKTGNNSYANTGKATVDGIDWVLQGNGTMNPWRIGGKSLTNEKRVVYTETAFDSALESIDLTIGGANQVTINSITLTYSANADFSDGTNIEAPSKEMNSTITFTQTGGFPANSYYKFTFDVTITATQNKFIEFKKVEFKGEAAPVTDPAIVVEITRTTEELNWIDACSDEGWWQIVGSDFSLSNSGSVTSPAGTYGYDDLDEDYSYVISSTNTKVTFTAGEIVVAVSAEGVITIKGDLTGTDDKIYRFDLTYDPTQTNPYEYDEDADFVVEFPSYMIDDSNFEEYGSIYITGQDQFNNYILLDMTLAGTATEAKPIAGTYTVDDSYDENTVYAGSYDLTYGLIPSFAGIIGTEGLTNVWYIVSGTVTVDANLNITVNAKNSLDHNITVTLSAGEDPTSIKNTEAAQKVLKAIENGQLMINVNGVKYNVNGARVK